MVFGTYFSYKTKTALSSFKLVTSYLFKNLRL